MNLENHLAKKHVLLVLCVLAGLVMVAVPMLRMLSNDPIIPGSQTYDEMQNARLFWMQGLHPSDPFSIEENPISITPFQMVISPIVQYVHTPWVLVLLQVMVGFATLFFLYRVLVFFNISKLEIRLMMAVLIFMPSFLFSFGTVSRYGIMVAATIGSLYFLLCQQRTWLAVVCAVIASIFSMVAGLVLLFTMLLVSERLPEFYKRTNLLVGVIISTSVIALLADHVFPAISIPLKPTVVLSMVVADLGAPLGFSVFSIVLAVIGVAYTWNPESLKYPYILSLLLMVLSLSSVEALVFVSLGSALFAGYSFAKLVSAEWHSLFLKEFTLLLVLFGLMFSIIAYGDRIVKAEPTHETEQALEWIARNTELNRIVLTHTSRNAWVHEWANRPTAPWSEGSALDQTWYSRDLAKMQLLFNQSQISYVYIDRPMRQGLVWDKQEGLLLLLENNETFKNVYDENGKEVWEYLYRP